MIGRRCTRRLVSTRLGAKLAAATLCLLTVVSGAVFPARAQALSVSDFDPIGLPGKLAAGAGQEIGAQVLNQALKLLTGGVTTKLTVSFIKFLVTISLPIGGTLRDATGPMIVIGGFFLMIGLITSVGDGYREVIAGVDTAPRVIGQAIFRVIGLSLLMASWYWLIPLVVDVANGLSGYILTDEAVSKALNKTITVGAEEGMLSPVLKVFPLLALLTAIAIAFAILLLVVLKYVMIIAFACLYVGGPALIGFGALPRIGPPLVAMLTRALFTLMLIPLVWCVVFVAWAGVNVGVTATLPSDGVVKALVGPGLFLAGLVVLVAVTKRLLAMAAFGMRLSLPGGGMMRMAATLAISRGIGAAIGKGGGAGAGTGASSGVPMKAAPFDAAHQATRTGSQGQAVPQAISLAEKSGEPRPAQPRRALQVQPQPALPPEGQRLYNEWASGQQRTIASSGFSDGTGGHYSGRGKPSADDYHRVRREVHDTPAPSPEQLGDATKELPVVERARAYNAAAAAEQQAWAAHPDDPGARERMSRRLYTDTVVRHTAGAPNLPRGVTTMAAAEPRTVLQEFAADGQAFGTRAPGAASTQTYYGGVTPSATSGGYDPALFAFAGAGGGNDPGGGGFRS